MKDKVVVITGASSGIGKAMAIKYAMQQSKVVIAARTIDKLKAVAMEISTFTPSVLTVQADVSKEEDCKMLIEKTIQEFGKIDILINNAGISMRALFNNTDLNVFKSVMDINFWGTVYCTKFSLPHLLKSQGSIIGVSSENL